MTMDSGFLEDWLHKVSSLSAPPKTPPPLAAPAQHIAHAWAQLRTCVQNGNLESEHLAILISLKEYGHALHVAEPQARLLLSILSSVTSADADALGQAQSSAAMLLSTWVRKSFKVATGSLKPSQEILNSIVDSTLRALERSDRARTFNGEAILLLGTLCLAAQIKEESRRICQEAIARESIQRRDAIVQGSLKEALAGIGYALVSSHGHHLTDILRALLLLWSKELSVDQEDQMLDSPGLKDGLMLLHLMEWCGSTFTSQPQLAGVAVSQAMVAELFQASRSYKTLSDKCAILLSAAGLLRSFYRWSLHGHKDSVAQSKWLSMMQSLESMMASMVDGTLQLQVKLVAENLQLNSNVNASHFGDRWHKASFPAIPPEEEHWVQCIALAFSRCSSFPSRSSILLCLTITLLQDALPLSAIYCKYIPNFWDLHEDFKLSSIVSPYGKGSKDSFVQKPHDSILLHEAGAIFRALCEQYRSADKGWQVWVENLFFQCSHSLYRNHRYFLAVTKKDARGSRNPESLNIGPENEILKKVLEAFLLSVVMFFSFATRDKTDAMLHDRGLLATQVLTSLSCLEFIRQGQVPEYIDLVQRCVQWVSASGVSGATVVRMLPAYDDVVHFCGRALESYSWTEDTVQDARMLFCFRVLPSCLVALPASSFLNGVAPILLLYLQHPSHNLSQASHSLFIAFISYNGDSQLRTESGVNGRDSIKEQLAVRYIERSLEEIHSISRFDFLVMGAGTIVRHLPAGSAATMSCLSCLTNKSSEMFRCRHRKQRTHQHNSSFQGPLVPNEAGDELETAKKFQTLLLHLILLVDIQVLPHALQEVARLILELPDPHREVALEEAFDILAGSDDLTRKYVLVPWLQSLSYLCSNPRNHTKSCHKESSSVMEKNLQNEDAPEGTEASGNNDAISLNPSSAWEDCRQALGSYRLMSSHDDGLLPWTSRSRL